MGSMNIRWDNVPHVDRDLESHLVSDSSDPGISIFRMAELAGVEPIEIAKATGDLLQTFQGEIYVPYSAIVERAETEEILRVFCP